MDQNEKTTPVSIVLDERLFSDTVLRVTRLSSTVFVVCDVRWLNGKNVFDTMSYSERRAKIEALLEMFHSPDLTALISYDEVPENTPVRGWETYDDKPGAMGVFLPASE